MLRVAHFSILSIFLLLSCWNVSGSPTGLASSRITSGVNVASGEFPFVVAIIVDGSFSCSGFIYNSRWIVTVASCMTRTPAILPGEVQVIVAQLSFITQDQDEESYEVNEIITHPDFNPTTHLNDIALIQVSRSIDFGERVKSVCYDQFSTIGDPIGVLMGWGSDVDEGLASTRLRKANIILEGDCEVYGTSYNQNYMICAGAEEDEASPCAYDEGSPLLQDDIVIGIMARQVKCGASPYFSSIYTRLSAYYRWLQQNAGLCEDTL